MLNVAYDIGNYCSPTQAVARPMEVVMALMPTTMFSLQPQHTSERAELSMLYCAAHVVCTL